MHKLRELRDRRGKLIEDARRILDHAENERRELTGDEKTAWDSLMTETDALKDRIAREERQVEEEREAAAREFERQGRGGAAESTSTRSGEGGWRDFRTGREVRLLRPEDRLAAPSPGGVGFGAYLRALAFGPLAEEERQMLSAAGGGFLVPSPIADKVIDRVRDASVLVRSGARTVTMEGATLTLVRISDDPAVNWHLESVEIPQSAPAFAAIELRARCLTSLIRVSRELLSDGENVEEALMVAFSGAIASALDAAFLSGLGASGEPAGLLAMSDIPTLDLGAAAGAPITYDSLLSALGVLWSAGDVQPTALIANPRDILALASLKETSTGAYLQPPAQLNGIKFLQSNGLSITETHGTATNASSAILGDFRHAIFAVRNQLELGVLRERYAEFYEVGFLVSMRCDFAVTQGGRFVNITGIIPAA